MAETITLEKGPDGTWRKPPLRTRDEEMRAAFDATDAMRMNLHYLRLLRRPPTEGIFDATA